MARKPASQGAAAAAANPAITDETAVVNGAAEVPAAAAPEPASAGDPNITDETVVVTGETVEPAPATATESPPASGEAASTSAAADQPGTDVVVVTCGIAAGRRRAGRRWDAGTTRVPVSELSDEQLVQLHADPVLRVSVEAA